MSNMYIIIINNNSDSYVPIEMKDNIIIFISDKHS